MSDTVKKDGMLQEEAHMDNFTVSDFILSCEKLDEKKLNSFLNQYVSETEKNIKTQGIDTVTKYVRGLFKGLRNRSKQSNALRYFYYGYFIRRQEEQLEQIEKKNSAESRMVLLSRKHYANILKYLYANGCSQQKRIAESLKIDKSNLNRIMNHLVESGLVSRSCGPRCVFLELSPVGYIFIREQSIRECQDIKKDIKSPLENKMESIKLERKKTRESFTFSERWLRTNSEVLQTKSANLDTDEETRYFAYRAHMFRKDEGEKRDAYRGIKTGRDFEISEMLPRRC